MIQKGMINGTYLVLHTTKSAFICKFSELSFSDTLKTYILWFGLWCDVMFAIKKWNLDIMHVRSPWNPYLGFIAYIETSKSESTLHCLL